MFNYPYINFFNLFVLSITFITINQFAYAEVSDTDFIDQMIVQATVNQDASVSIHETIIVNPNGSTFKTSLTRCLPLEALAFRGRALQYEFQFGYINKERIEVTTKSDTKHECFILAVPKGGTLPEAFILHYKVTGLIFNSKEFDSLWLPATSSWPIPINHVQVVLRIPEFMLAKTAQYHTSIRGISNPAKSDDTLVPAKITAENELTWTLSSVLRPGTCFDIGLRIPKGFLR